MAACTTPPTSGNAPTSAAQKRPTDPRIDVQLSLNRTITIKVERSNKKILRNTITYPLRAAACSGAGASVWISWRVDNLAAISRWHNWRRIEVEGAFEVPFARDRSPRRKVFSAALAAGPAPHLALEPGSRIPESDAARPSPTATPRPWVFTDRNEIDPVVRPGLRTTLMASLATNKAE